jgi:hypothetical protein
VRPVLPFKRHPGDRTPGTRHFCAGKIQDHSGGSCGGHGNTGRFSANVLVHEYSGIDARHSYTILMDEWETMDRFRKVASEFILDCENQE